MPLAIQAKNYRGLVEVDWTIPPGLSVVVGANGAGKTTLLYVMDVLRQTACSDRGLAATVDVYGGSRALKHLGAAPDASVVLGARWDDIDWQIEPLPVGDGLASFPAERLRVGGKVLFDHPSGSPTARWQGKEPTEVGGIDTMSVVRRVALLDFLGPSPARPLLDALEGCRIYHDPMLRQLRQGSEVSAYKRLHSDGTNAFSVLRNWKDWTPDRIRYDFVKESLRDCFGFFGDLDFQTGGRIAEGHVVHRAYGGSFPANFAAEGWLVALLHFTAVAGADRGQIVAIDSFENALHPRALLKALELIRDYADAKGMSVVLTTQSPQVIDGFEAHPDRIFVLDPRHCPGPRPLTDLRTDEWLAHFRLGSEFADGDFGSEPLE